MTTRRLLAATAALMTFGAVSPAAAQITTTMARPKANEQAQVQAARREAAAQDSVARVTLTGMKEWVDSAANALAIQPDTAGVPSDTGVAAPEPPVARDDSTRSAAVVPARAGRNEAEREFREGGRAPDTATPVPTIALAGGVLIVVGVLLRRRSAAAVRARR